MKKMRRQVWGGMGQQIQGKIQTLFGCLRNFPGTDDLNKEDVRAFHEWSREWERLDQGQAVDSHFLNFLVVETPWKLLYFCPCTVMQSVSA